MSQTVRPGTAELLKTVGARVVSAGRRLQGESTMSAVIAESPNMLPSNRRKAKPKPMPGPKIVYRQHYGAFMFSRRIGLSPIWTVCPGEMVTWLPAMSLYCTYFGSGV